MIIYKDIYLEELYIHQSNLHWKNNNLIDCIRINSNLTKTEWIATEYLEHLIIYTDIFNIKNV